MQNVLKIYKTRKYPVLGYIYGVLMNTNTSQYAERILNKTAKAINETFAGLKLMLQGFRIYFV